MNVFFTDFDPIIAAKHHCVRHRNKMIVEYAQLLSAAHHVLDGDTCIAQIYKLSHKNHPSAVWVRQSRKHYDWVLQCAMQLCELYRQHKWLDHNTLPILRNLHTYPVNLPDTNWSSPPACVSDELKELYASTDASITDVYKLYMIEKFNEWQNRDKPLSIDFYKSVPDWITDQGINYTFIRGYNHEQ